MRRGYRGTDAGGNRYADPKPRFASLGQQRREAKVRNELSGETDKREINKVTLPKFSWDK